MPRRLAFALLPLVAATLLAQSAPAGASVTGSAARLSELQSHLDLITERIRVGTAVWLALVRGVRAQQAEIRRATAEMRRVPKHSGQTSRLLVRIHTRIALTRRALASVLPAWLAVKASLHRDYRLVKTLLARAEPTVVAILGPRLGPGSAARWRRAWPLHLTSRVPVRACPVQGPLSLTDSFGAPRPGGRIHEGNDLFGARRTPVVAVQHGLVVREPNSLGGRAIVLHTAAGYFYYAHLAAYGAAGQVPAGATIGFLGSSGDARGGMPHVHFEYHPEGGPAVDPFPVLQPVC